MARVNTDILGISKLKWTGMGELNSDDHYIYYCWQESLRRNGVAIMVIEAHFNSESQQNHLEDIYTAIKLTVCNASHAPPQLERQ